MHSNNFELFESFDYLNDEQLEKIINMTKEMSNENFEGFKGTSLGTNMKDALSFCIAYFFIEKNYPIDKFIWATSSYQEEFFQHSLVHLENISCIKKENLLPYFAVSAKNFSTQFLKNNKEFKLMETKDWISDFLSTYNENKLNYNLDTPNSKYIDKFIEVENRILNVKLEKKLPEKMYDVKKRKI